MAALPQLADFVDKVIVIVLGELQAAGSEAVGAASPKIKKQLFEVLMLSVFVYVWQMQKFRLDLDQEQFTKKVQLLLNKHKELINYLNILKEKGQGDITSGYFYGKYMLYTYESSENKLSVIEYLKINQKQEKKMGLGHIQNLKQLAQKINNQHWSVSLANASQSHLKTIHKKYQTWKSIIDPKSQFQFEKDV